MMRIWRYVVALSVLSACLPHAAAQGYPGKPVRIINPFAAGGGLDALLRPLAQKLSEGLGQPFIVDNKAGANGMIGSELVAKAAPDGYTLLAGTTGALSLNAIVYPKLPYDPVKDFAPISSFAESGFILSVHPSVPAGNVQELIALARSRPGQLTYASFGVASSSHLLAELFSMAADVKMVHVPYKGSAPAVADLLSGQVALMFDSMQSQMPHLRAKRLRALGLAAARRSAAAPEVPTLAEAGLAGVEGGSWYGLLAPAGTPREIVERLHAEVRKALAAPELRQRFESAGADPVGNTPAEFAAQIRADIEKWGTVVRSAGIRAE
jgi:tripartite-type tricarboxylate transporter receptor subunit TctC